MAQAVAKIPLATNQGGGKVNFLWWTMLAANYVTVIASQPDYGKEQSWRKKPREGKQQKLSLCLQFGIMFSYSQSHDYSLFKNFALFMGKEKQLWTI